VARHISRLSMTTRSCKMPSAATWPAS
jgi:hypothetical protein